MSIRMDEHRVRRTCDRSISVADLQEVIRAHCKFVGSRDLLATFSELVKHQGETQSSKPLAMSKSHDFFRILFQVVANGRVPGSKLELALANEDCSTTRGRLNVSGKPLEQFTAKITAAVLLGRRNTER